MKTGIRRGVKQFFSDMTRKERKEYLKAVETRIAAWHDKIVEVLNGNILEVLQEGYSMESKTVNNGLVAFKKALSFYAENCQTLLEWRELMKGAGKKSEKSTEKGQRR